MKTSTPEITERTPAMHLFGPSGSAASARSAALRLVTHLPMPSAAEHIASCYAEPGATLCHADPKPIVSSPTAFFESLSSVDCEIPEEWTRDHAEWVVRIQRTRAFERACLCLDTGQQPTEVQDPILAGLLLYQRGGTASPGLRQTWFDLALGSKSTAAAWLAAEGLHTVDEREKIVAAVGSDSRHLWWTSQVAGMGALAAKHAGAHLDIYGGLVMASHATDEAFEAWLRRTLLAARECADAACAALVLQPEASAVDKACWITALQNQNHEAAQQAYEAVRWAQYTWPREAWEGLRDLLRPSATADGGRAFYHWYRDIEKNGASAALGTEGISLLWGAELIASLNGEVDDYALRFRLGERLGSVGDSAATLVLSYLNSRNQHCTE